MARHIGSTTYSVKIYLPQAVTPSDGMPSQGISSLGAENMEDKILRMIQNEALENAADCGMMDVPQMSRQSERSANERETG